MDKFKEAEELWDRFKKKFGDTYFGEYTIENGFASGISQIEVGEIFGYGKSQFSDLLRGPDPKKGKPLKTAYEKAIFTLEAIDNYHRFITDKLEQPAIPEQDSFVIRDKKVFRRVIKNHNQKVFFELLYEVIEIHTDLHNVDRGIDEDYLREMLQDSLRSVIQRTRNQLYDLGFKNPKGENIITILESVYPSEKLFTVDDNIFQKQLEQMFLVIKDKDLLPSEMYKHLSRISDNLGTKQLNTLWKVGWESNE